MDELNCVSKASVPGYEMLDSFEWLDDFLRIQEIKQEIKELRARKRETRNAHPTRKSLIENAKEHIEAHQQRRVEIIRNHYVGGLRRGQRNINVFNYLKYHHNSETFPPYIDIKEVEEAISQIPDSAGVSDADVEKKLEEIDRERTELTMELSELSPTVFFRLADGRATDDIRERFVEHWFEIQHKVNGPCGPQGVTLGKSSFAERAAWEKLGLGQAVRKNIYTYPNQGRGFVAGGDGKEDVTDIQWPERFG